MRYPIPPEVNIELCVDDDVVYSYTCTTVPQKGEMIHTYTNEKNSKRSFLIVDRQWYCFPDVPVGVILTVEELK